MSSRDYYKHSARDALPPIRDVLGDQLDSPPRHDSAYSFDAVNRALPSTTSSSRSRSTWPITSGPTLPPIHAASHSAGYASAGATTPSYPSPYSSHPSHPPARSSHSHSHSHTEPSSTRGASDATRASPYSFDVFRPSSSGLVHASSSSRSQGILRSTRADAGKKHAPHSSLTDDDHDDRQHNDDTKRYVCTHCGKRFSRPSSLRTHAIVHSDQKPYECPHPGCGKTFTVPSNMRRHFRKTHEGAGSGDGEDDADEHYQTDAAPSSSRYFHTPSSRTNPSAHYYSSSRR